MTRCHWADSRGAPITGKLPDPQRRDRAECYLYFEACGWSEEDAWEAALSLDVLMIGMIQRIAEVVPDEVIVRALAHSRAPEPNAALRFFDRAELNNFVKPPAKSEITITVGSRPS